MIMLNGRIPSLVLLTSFIFSCILFTALCLPLSSLYHFNSRWCLIFSVYTPHFLSSVALKASNPSRFLPSSRDRLLFTTIMAGLPQETFSEYPDQAAFKGPGARKLQQMANDNMLRRLAAAVDGQAVAATFACGGSLLISSCLRGDDSDDDSIVPCLQLRWNTKDSAGGRLRFPLTPDDQTGLQELVEACQPAAFGLGGKEVLDQSYRKAGKLDRSDFLTDFHPHDCGIIDSIHQILLPSMTKGGEGIGIGTRGVRAELYKLNVGWPGPLIIRFNHSLGYTPVLLGCSISMSTLHVELRILARWSSACLAATWVSFYGDWLVNQVPANAVHVRWHFEDLAQRKACNI